MTVTADEHRKLKHAAALAHQHLEKSADGKFLVECDGLFCPQCGGKCERSSPSLCWNCPNPDDGGEIPRPCFDSWLLDT